MLIDFENYRQAISSEGQLTKEIASNQSISIECVLKNGEYRICGKSCVLHCRHDSMAVKFFTSNEKCDATKCVEGCFCKDGFVRYHNECVPIADCAARGNKAMDFSQIKIDNSTHIASQEHTSDPKTFSSLNRPPPIQFQAYDETMQRKEVDRLRT